MNAKRSACRSFLFLLLTSALLLACDSVSTDDPRGTEGASPDVEEKALREGPSQPDKTNPSDLPRDLRPAFQKPGTWTFAESAALTCRDGSSTGIGVRLQEDETPSRRGGPFNLDNYSDDLVIYLEGGGACFNPFTCSQNRSSFSEEQFFSDDFIGGYSGIFAETRSDNPVADWNFVYVPYCTGDEHAGSTESGSVPPLDLSALGGPVLPGLHDQKFVGYDNVGRVLDYIDRHLGKNYDRVLLTGASAGGVGALANYRQVAAAFPGAEITLLNDSGPVFYDDSILPVALQQKWRSTWDLSEALPAGSEGSDVLQEIYGDIASTTPDASLGFISYRRDATIRFFYSFGRALSNPACAKTLYGGLLNGKRTTCIGGDTYEGALQGLRAQLPSPWTTFYTSLPNPELHTFLRSERFYEAEAGGQALSAWTRDLIGEGSPPARP